VFEVQLRDDKGKKLAVVMDSHGKQIKR